jgi:hypothetical protein
MPGISFINTDYHIILKGKKEGDGVRKRGRHFIYLYLRQLPPPLIARFTATPERSCYRCFLPDLTGFTGSPCTGPSYQD